jgi:hypothetical protein
MTLCWLWAMPAASVQDWEHQDITEGTRLKSKTMQDKKYNNNLSPVKG